MSEPSPQPLSRPLAPSNKSGRAIPAFLRRWTPVECAELFAVGNLAFLGVDIFVAHSVNHFRHPAERAPIAFSGAAAAILLVAILFRGLAPRPGAARRVGLLVGWGAIAVGVTGLLLHLNSQFFEQLTLKSLVYTAPFSAPLAYAGLGLLLLLDRMVDTKSFEWSAWIILLAMGGFFGNLILSLADHAGNGFYVWSEWIPVVAAAFATTFLAVPLLMEVSAGYLRICGALMALEALVGAAGFGLHLYADLHGPARSLRDNFLYGAPAFAPLLFPNLAALAGIGLWSMIRNQTPAPEEPAIAGETPAAQRV